MHKALYVKQFKEYSDAEIDLEAIGIISKLFDYKIKFSPFLTAPQDWMDPIFLFSKKWEDHKIILTAQLHFISFFKFSKQIEP